MKMKTQKLHINDLITNNIHNETEKDMWQLKKVYHKSEEEMGKRMKMTSQRAENLVHVLTPKKRTGRKRK